MNFDHECDHPFRSPFEGPPTPTGEWSKDVLDAIRRLNESDEDSE